MSLLPGNSTPFELAAEQAMDEFDVIAPALDGIRGVKYARPLNPTVAPWLVEEYGLGQISPYFGSDGTVPLSDGSSLLTTEDGTVLVVGTSIEVLIDEGRRWQKIRGTPDAIATALGWIQYYDVVIEDQAIGRRRWHLYQINMGELPLPDEEQRLADAEYLAGISDPARSIFSRGYFGYDVRVLVWGRRRWGRSIWGDSSGVFLPPGETKWSHGRAHEISLPIDQGDLDALGIDFNNGDDISWDQGLSWDTEGTTWAGVVDAYALRAWVILHSDAYLGLFDVSGSPIGYIKILTTPETDVTTGTVIRYDARTSFGDGGGQSVASAGLVFGGVNGPSVKPFKRWLEPDEIAFPSGQVVIGPTPVSFDLMKTVREFFTVDFVISS